MENAVNTIRAFTEGQINELGYDLYHVEYVEEEGDMFLRFYIENREKDLPISLDDCEKISRKISAILDDKDPIEEMYFLEVSSPGIFRGLYTEEHIRRALGEKVNVRLFEDTKGKKNFNGILKDLKDGKIIINHDEKESEIDLKIVKSINLNPEI